MDAVAAIRQNIRWGNEILEMVMADVTDATARWTPPGLVNPIGALYAHALIGEDGIVNGLLRGGAPRFATAGEQIGVAGAQMSIELDWARRVTPDLAALQALGRLDEAEQALLDAHAQAAAQPSYRALWTICAALARLAAQRGDAAGAERWAGSVMCSAR